MRKMLRAVVFDAEQTKCVSAVAVEDSTRVYREIFELSRHSEKEEAFLV